MKTILFLSVLLLPAPVFGQTYDIVGAQDSANTNFTMDTLGVAFITASSKRYTASTGDTAIWAAAWSQIQDSAIVALYRWHTAGDSATTCFKSDTFAVSTGSSYDSSAILWGLEPGTTYVATFQCGDKSGNLGYFKVYDIGPDQSILSNSMVTGDNYTSLSLSYDTSAYTTYVRVAQYGSSGTPLGEGAFGGSHTYGGGEE